MTYFKYSQLFLLFVCFFGANIAFGQVKISRDVLLCPGESINVYGVVYANADTFDVIVSGAPNADTVVTYRIQVLPGVQNPQSCNCHPSSFFKVLGRENQSEYISAMVKSRDGNVYLAGLKAGKTFIQKINPSGESYWLREFAINQFEPVLPTDLVEDSEGLLLGIGTQGQGFTPRKGFVFKYNPESNQFLWAKSISSNNVRSVGGLELGSGGNYLIYQNIQTQSGTAEAEMLEIDRNTGNIIPDIAKRYKYQGSDVLAKLVRYDDMRLFGTGASTVKAGVNAGFRRQLLAEFGTFNGGVAWAQISHQDTVFKADYNGRDLIIDGNALVALYDGNETLGFPTSNSAVFLMKKDLSGNTLWLKRFQIPGNAFKLLSDAGGYLIYGQLSANTWFFVRTDKSGDPLWARKLQYGASGSAPLGFGPSMGLAFNNGYMFTGSAASGINDAYLLRLDLDGNVKDSCAQLEAIDLDYQEISNPFSGNILLNTKLSTANTSNQSLQSVSGVLFEQFLCPDCVPPNLCPAGNDFVVDLVKTTCGEGDINLELRICDQDGGKLPSSIQVAFYDANPTQQAAQNIGNFTFDTEGADSCKVFEISDLRTELGSSFVKNGVKLFALVNFDGVLSAPFSFDDFPVTNLEECNYTNNLDSFVVQLPVQPTLELGSNKSICAGETAILTPGPVFYKYNWSNGSANDSLFIKFNGQFSLTVTDACGNTQTDQIGVAVKPWPSLTQSGVICPGKSIMLHGLEFNQGGIFLDTIPASLGNACDTVVTTFITQLPYQTREQQVYFCPGTGVSINGIFYDESGLVRDTVSATSGCDTVVLYFLNTLPKPFRFDTAYICPGSSVTINGIQYDQEGIFFDTLPSFSSIACDTVLRLQVIFKQQTSVVRSYQICPGGSVSVLGKVYTQAGLFQDLIPAQNAQECDTLLTLNITVKNQITRDTSLSICPGGSVSVLGKVYTQAGQYQDLIPAQTNQDCDTLLAIFISVKNQITKDSSISFCPGSSVVIGGQTYNSPGIVKGLLPGFGVDCDTIINYILSYSSPQSAQLSLVCPTNVQVASLPGSGGSVVQYSVPVASSNCNCAGIDLERSTGPASGANFPVGLTTVCYKARDYCSATATCCFTVKVVEEAACDVKINGCVKYELMRINTYSNGEYAYTFRVTNACSNKLIYTAIELPLGVEAVQPGNNSIYNSAEGRKYLVRNPNYSPFYSIRFKSGADSISNGQSATFTIVLPKQIRPNFFNISSRLAPQVQYDAYLNTFNCPISPITQNREAQQDSDTHLERTNDLVLFPNPNAGGFFVDLTPWADQKLQLQVYDELGRQVYQQPEVLGGAVFNVQMPEKTPVGWYVLQVKTADGTLITTRFVVEN